MKLGISIDTFIDYLSHLETPDEMSLNMYKGNTLGAEVRREQPRFYLEAMRENNPSKLFVGEAPGRNGCLQSGLAGLPETAMKRILQCLDFRDAAAVRLSSFNLNVRNIFEYQFPWYAL